MSERSTPIGRAAWDGRGPGPAALAADRISRKAQFQDNNYATTAGDEDALRVDVWERA